MEQHSNSAVATWEPKRTWVVAVGVIEGAWSTETRRDTVLLETLKAQGVPEAQVLFLADSEATIDATEERMAAHLAQASVGDLVIFYFTGYSGGSDSQHFVLTDGDWPIHRIFALIEQHFTGSHALLLGDTAYSGALAAQLSLRTGRIAYAALTSSVPTGCATGTWIYTDSLIEAFEGKTTDADGDGYISLTDVASHVERQMAADAGKLPSFVASVGFPVAMRLVPARTPEGRVGEYVEARDRWGGWVPARIDEERGGEYHVRYCNYLTNPRAWVPASDVRPREQRTIPLGDSVQVISSGWAVGTVVAARAGLYLVHYDSDQGDEWVSSAQLRMPAE
jgi:hypothetical protein